MTYTETLMGHDTDEPIILTGPGETKICKCCFNAYASKGKADNGLCPSCNKELGYEATTVSGNDEAVDKVESYVQEAIKIANDNIHGYSMQNRNGDPDYDCSSLVCNVVQRAGIPVMDNGASYTGNMREAFLKSGFVIVKVNLANCDGMVRGDILLNDQSHTAIYIGNKQIVQAGGADGHPEPGDQTGNEIRTMGYYNFPWSVVLRYPHDLGDPNNIQPDEPYVEPPHVNNEDYPYILKYGDWGEDVKSLQLKLEGLGFYQGEIDGKFGNQTFSAVYRFQEKYRLMVDGEAGPETKGKLNELVGNKPTQNIKTYGLGHEVVFKGGKAYLWPSGFFGTNYNAGRARITAIKPGAKYPYHLCGIRKESDVYGWVDANAME